MFKIVVCSAVNCLCGYDVIALLGKCLECISKSCRTRCNCQCCNTAFKGCYSLFKNIFCRVCKSAVDVTRISQTETVSCVL